MLRVTHASRSKAATPWPFALVTSALLCSHAATVAEQLREEGDDRAWPVASVTLQPGHVYALADICAEIRRQTGVELFPDRAVGTTEILLSQGSTSLKDLMHFVCIITGFDVREVGTVFFIVEDGRSRSERRRDEFEKALDEQSKGLQAALSPVIGSQEVLDAEIPFDMESVLRKTSMLATDLTDKQMAFLVAKCTDENLAGTLRQGEQVFLKFAPFFFLELVFRRRQVITIPGSTTRVENLQTATIRRFGAF